MEPTTMTTIRKIRFTVLPLPDGLSYENATFSTLGSVALHALRRLDLAFGETVVILGAGIIGLLATQMARRDGARPAGSGGGRLLLQDGL